MWFWFALLFAITSSLGMIISKRIMRAMDEYWCLWISGLFTLPFLFLIVIYFYHIPHVDRIFFFAVGTSIILDIMAAVFAYRAIKISEVSLVAPLSAFNPVFTAIISFVFLRELVSLKELAGIVVICIGAYLLGISKTQKSLLSPIKTLLTNKAVQLSLMAYFIWAITPIFQKIAIFHTNPPTPPFVSFSGMVGTAFFFGILATKFSHSSFNGIKSSIKKFLPLFLLLGVLAGIGQTAAFVTFSLTKLGLATAIFKLSMIFSVVLGWIFFKEKNIKDRLIGSIVMLMGVFLLVL